MIIPEDGIVISEYCFCKFDTDDSAVYFTVVKIDDPTINDEDQNKVKEIISQFGLWEDKMHLEYIRTQEIENKKFIDFEPLHDKYAYDLIPIQEIFSRSGKRYGLILKQRYKRENEKKSQKEMLITTVRKFLFNVNKYRTILKY